MNQKSFIIWKKMISLALMFIILTVPMIAQMTQPTSDYMQGRLDGEAAAEGSPAWLLGGLICGLFAVLYCYLSAPSPPAVALVGKSQDYVLGYTDGYKRKTRTKNAMYSWIGWGIWVVVYFAAVYPNLGD